MGEAARDGDALGLAPRQRIGTCVRQVEQTQTLEQRAGTVFAQTSWFEASANRYMYVAVVFLILLVSAIVRRFAWTGALATVMVALVFVSLIGNAVEFKHEFNLVQRESVAEAVVLKTINAVRRAPDLKRRGVLPRLLGAATVQVGPLLIAERQFGQAVPRATLQALASSDPAIVDTVLRLVLARGLNVAATSSPHTCAAPPLRTFTLPSGGARVLVVNGDAKVQIELGWASTPEPARTVTLHTGAWKLRVPNIGMKRFTWRVVLNTTGGSVSAC